MLRAAQSAGRWKLSSARTRRCKQVTKIETLFDRPEASEFEYDAIYSYPLAPRRFGRFFGVLLVDAP
jgi:hypothetical protein